MGKANILGVLVDQVVVEDILAVVRDVAASNQRALIAPVHVMGLNLAYENLWLRDFLNNANLVPCEGMGVKLGASLLGYHFPRLPVIAEWMWSLAALAEEQGFSFYFLGNPPGTAEKAAKCLQARYSGLQVVGAHHGYFEKSLGHPQNEAVVRQVNAAKTKILCVGFGMPAQEKWLLENWERLDVNVAITSGGLLEYIGGGLTRGPSWMTENYLEWLHRMMISPTRYGKRYLRDNPLFFYRILKQWLSTKISSESTLEM